MIASLPAHNDTLVLTVEGLTSASRASRVERRLNKISGVFATVNFATEKATVSYDTGRVSAEHIMAEIAATGFTAHPTSVEYQAVLPGRDGVLARPSLPLESDCDRTGALRARATVAGLLLIPVFLLSSVQLLHVAAWQWVVLGFAGVPVLWSASDLHRRWITGLVHGALAPETTASLGILLCYGASVWAVANGDLRYLHFVTAVAITFAVLIGRYCAARAQWSAGAPLRVLLSYQVQEARIVTPDGERRVPAQRLKVGEEFSVRPGEKIAADGVVTAGASSVDASVLTGEPRPISVVPGSVVTGATINLTERLVVRATHTNSDSFLAQVAQLIHKSQDNKVALHRRADRVAGWLTALALIIAAAVFIVRYVSGGSPNSAAFAAVAVLMAASPAAFALTIPIALLTGGGRGAQLGIIIASLRVVERIARADTVLLDKTGTVTTGQVEVAGITSDSETTPHEVVRVAGALESYSQHAIGAAISAHLRVGGDNGLAGSVPEVTGFASHAGRGLTGIVDGRMALVGRPSFLAQRGARISAPLQEAITEAVTAGRTPIVVAWGGHVRGVMVVTDQLKSTSTAGVRRLRSLKLRPMLVTGDNLGAATAVASQLNIPSNDVAAGISPVDKASLVRRLQALGRGVVMVGDGVSDAAALAQADIGIALGAGTAITRQSADLTVVRSELASVYDALRLVRRVRRVIMASLGWVTLYHLVVAPLVVFGLVAPLWAAVSSAATSTLVVATGLRLREFEPTHE